MSELHNAKQYQNQRRKHSVWRNIVTGIAAVVVFCTTYALILPAITMEGKQTYCGLEEHSHTEECFELICGREERYIHYHEDSCYNENDELNCRLSEPDFHVHSDDCYRELTCEQEECEAHTHEDACYEQVASLICEQEESEEHTHSDECYVTENTLTCDKEETDGHTHSDDCYKVHTETICDEYQPELHSHSADCFEAICGSEAHIHNDDCYTAPDTEETENVEETEEATGQIEEIAEETSEIAEQSEAAEETPEITEEAAEETEIIPELSEEAAEETESIPEPSEEATEETENVEETEEATEQNEEIAEETSEIAEQSEAAEETSETAEETEIIPELSEEAAEETEIIPESSEEETEATEATEATEEPIPGTPAENTVEPAEATEETAETAQENSESSENTELPEEASPAEESQPEEPEREEPEPEGEKETPEEPEEDIDWSDPEAAEEAGYILFLCEEEEHTHTRDCYLTEAEVAELLSEIATLDEHNTVDFTNYVTSISTQKLVNNMWTNSDVFADGDDIKVSIAYELPTDTLVNGKNSICYHLPSGVHPNAGQSGTVKDEREGQNGRVIGQYTISESGEILITFNDEFIAKNEPISGEIHFEGEANMSSGSDHQDITFPGTGTNITIIPHGSIETGKDSGVEKVNGGMNGDGTINYTVKVTTQNGTPDPLNLYDTLNGAAYNQGSVQIQKVTAGGTTAASGYSVSFSENGDSKKMDITNLPALANSTEYYLVTYSVTPNAPAPNGAQMVDNRIQTNTWVQATDQIEISKAKISKSGFFDQSTGLINWIVTVNENGGNIGGWTLQDTLPEGLNIVGPIKVQQNWQDYTGGTAQITGNGFTYTFPQDASGKFEISYSSEAPEADGSTVTNDADFTDDQGHTYTAEATPTVHRRTESLQKYPQTTEAVQLTPDSRKNVWKSELTLADRKFSEYGSFTYADTILAPASPAGAQHYGTAADIVAAIQSSIKFDYYDKQSNQSASIDHSNVGNYFTYEVTCYTEKDGTVVAQSDTTPVTYFTVTVTPKAEVAESVVGKKIEFQYPTIVTFEGLQDNETVKSQNKGEFGGVEVTAEQSYKREPKLEKGIVLGNDFSSADWTTEYTAGQTIKYRIVVRPKLNENGDIILTDTLPKGVTFTGLSKWEMYESGNPYYRPGQIWNNNNQIIYDFTTTGANKPTWTYNAETNQATITIPGGYNSPSGGQERVNPNIIELEYEVTLTDAIWENDGQFTIALVNNLVTTGAETNHSTTVTRIPPVVAKTGYQLKEDGTPFVSGTDQLDDADNVIRYTVVINPAAQDLDPESDTVTLHDNLTASNTESAALKLDSIRLYTYSSTAEGNKGTPVDSSMYQLVYHDSDPTKPGFDITFQDSQALVLEYEYKVNQGANRYSPKVSNEVTLSGETASAQEIEIKTNSSGASAQKASIHFYKVDAKDYSNLLDGAEFTISAYKNYNWQTGVTVGTENGELKIEAKTTTQGREGYFQVEKDVLYRLEETQSPDGYRAGEPVYFAWLVNKSVQQIDVPYFFDRNVIRSLGNDGGTVCIPNEPSSIYVKKVWQDSKGNTVDPRVNSVTLELRQQTIQWNSRTVRVHIGSKDWFGNESFGDPQEYVVATGSEFKIAFQYMPNSSLQYWIGEGGTRTTLQGDNVTSPLSYGTITQDCDLYFIPTNGWVGNYTYQFENPSEKSTGDWVKYDEISLPRMVDGNAVWDYRWPSLPANDGHRTEYYYSVVETSNPNGWTISYSANNGKINTGSIAVINTVPYEETPKTTLQLDKIWKQYDENDQLTDLEPDDSLTAVFKLYKREENSTEQGTQVGSDITLPDEDGNWSWTSERLPLVEGGKNLEYYFVESEIEGFKLSDPEISDEGNTFTFTNVKIPKKSISVEKKWQDQNGAAITNPTVSSVEVVLKSKPQGSTDPSKIAVVDTQELNQANNWSYTWPDLNHFDGDGNVLLYFVKEITVPNFVVSYTNNDGIPSGTITVTNTEKPKTRVEVHKVWKLNGVESQVLYQNMDPITFEVWKKTTCESDPEFTVDDEKLTDTITVSKASSWSGSLENLPVTGVVEGKEVTYSYYVVEEIPTSPAPIYRLDGIEKNADGTVFIATNVIDGNTHIGVQKLWTDQHGNPLSIDPRIKPINVYLFRSETVIISHPTEDPVTHQHSAGTAFPNNDGTHDINCAGCEELYADNEACNTSGANGGCSVCGYGTQHVHNPGTPSYNGDGTHNVPCTGCSNLITDHGACDTSGAAGSCSVCGHTPEHQHTAGTPVYNNDGTHNVPCQTCSELIKNHETCDTAGNGGACSVCGHLPEVHTHTPGAYVSLNNGKHKQACTANDGYYFAEENCTADERQHIDATATHRIHCSVCDGWYIEDCTMVGGRCQVCQYTETHTHTFKYTSQNNGKHLVECTANDGYSETENCTMVDGTCSKCNYHPTAETNSVPITVVLKHNYETVIKTYSTSLPAGTQLTVSAEAATIYVQAYDNSWEHSFSDNNNKHQVTWELPEVASYTIQLSINNYSSDPDFSYTCNFDEPAARMMTRSMAAKAAVEEEPTGYLRKISLAAGNWEWSSDMPLYGTNAAGDIVRYSYWFVEQTGYNPTITFDDATGITTITNKLDTSYELPHTGGMGTQAYTLAGLALSLGAVVGLMKKKQKRGNAD